MNLTWSAQEMLGAQIGDERSRANLLKLCGTLAAQPGIAFSRACGESGRKAAHRLFRQTRTTPAGLLAGHFAQTAARCQQLCLPLVLAASDTTNIDFTSHRGTKDLGPISHSASSRGFLTHSVLALTPEGLPLGLVHQEHWVRPLKELPRPRPNTPEGEKAHAAAKRRAYADKESFKWQSALQAVERALPAEQPVLLIQDREADIFEFLCAQRRANTHLLIRAVQPRRVCVVSQTAPPMDLAGVCPDKESACPEKEPVCLQNLWEVLEQAPVAMRHEIQVGRQKDQAARQVVFAIKYVQVEIAAPKQRGAALCQRAPQRVWLLEAKEILGTGQTRPALHWAMLCTLPIGDALRAVEVIQYYAHRWQIERFHYVLKSGCKVEDLQIDRASSLQKAMSIYSVVSWWLLYLTHLARIAPQTPADTVMEASVLAVVSAGEPRPVTTVGALILAVAKVGGFRRLPSAPHPGVKSLWLGLRRLYDRYLGWQLALQNLKNAGQD